MDIRITKGKYRATVFGESPKGRVWMTTNVIGTRITNQSTYTMIDIELVEDMAKDMVDADLIVEIL